MNAPANQFTRLDAAESAFFLRELSHIEQRMFETKYPELKYATLIPTRTGFDEGALQYIYRMMNEFGAAEIISDKSQRFPRVDVKGDEYTGPVRIIGDAYGYSIMEIKGAQKAGRPLEQMRANTARKQIFRKLDRVAMFGDVASGLKGFVNHSSVTATDVADGASASKAWSTKTPAEIIADLNAPFENIDSDTKGTEAANTVVLPNTSYRHIAMTPYGVDSDKTILEWWKAANPGVAVESSHHLETAGASSSKRMITYKRDPEVLELLNPHGFQQMEPLRHGVEYEVVCFMTTAGVIVRYPKAIRYQDKI
jgi:hypothetical protein